MTYFVYIVNSFKTSHSTEPVPTTDTVNSLVYAMKDFIRWFGKLASEK